MKFANTERRRKLVMVANKDAPGGVTEMSPFRLSVELASLGMDALSQISAATWSDVGANWGLATLTLVFSFSVSFM